MLLSILQPTGISKLLSKIHPPKANGTDQMPMSFLKDYAEDIPYFLRQYKSPQIEELKSSIDKKYK